MQDGTVVPSVVPEHEITDMDWQLSLLNDVLGVLQESGMVFAATSDFFRDPKQKRKCARIASACDSSAQLLADRIVQMGGKPIGNSRVTGMLRQTWITVKSSVEDEQAIVGICIQQARDALRICNHADSYLIPSQSQPIWKTPAELLSEWLISQRAALHHTR